mmetsp:Transcript_7930/g.14392  ORF Transcript_7930/g.14392 Transcript_7930/m.14392 type:complete len:353 (+) Transcript_7930:77-1135(+)
MYIRLRPLTLESSIASVGVPHSETSVLVGEIEIAELSASTRLASCRCATARIAELSAPATCSFATKARTGSFFARSIVSSHGSWSSGCGAQTAVRHIGQFDCCPSHCNMHGKWKWCLQAGRHTMSSPSKMSSAHTGHSIVSCSCSSIFASSPALALWTPEVVAWSCLTTVLTTESFRYCTTSCEAGSSAALAAFIVSVTCAAAVSVESKSAFRFWLDCMFWFEKKTMLKSSSSGFSPEVPATPAARPSPSAPPDEGGLAMIVLIISCRFWNSKNSLPHRGQAVGFDVCTRYTRRHAWHRSWFGIELERDLVGGDIDESGDEGLDGPSSSVSAASSVARSAGIDLVCAAGAVA